MTTACLAARRRFGLLAFLFVVLGAAIATTAVHASTASLLLSSSPPPSSSSSSSSHSSSSSSSSLPSTRSKKHPRCFANLGQEVVALAQAPPTARWVTGLAGTWERSSSSSSSELRQVVVVQEEEEDEEEEEEEEEERGASTGVRAAWGAAPFWNLSCPLEWSKYSCVHQGAEAHAASAASWRFVPRDCALPRLLRPEALTAALGNRTVFIGGDSLARQVFISLGCRLLRASISASTSTSSTSVNGAASPTAAATAAAAAPPPAAAVVHAEAEWGGPHKRRWSCGGVKNCIEEGPHSGFFSASVSLTTTSSTPAATATATATVRTSIVSLDLVTLMADNEQLVTCHDGSAGGSSSSGGGGSKCVIRRTHPIRAGDIVVLEGGVHGPANNSAPVISKWLRELNAIGALPVWLPTWPPAFESVDGSGDYRPDFLSKRKAANGGTPVACVNTTSNARAVEEREILKAHGAEVVAVLELEGIENLGSAKVGASLPGGLGDCQHYCLPGPPGAYAQALYALLLGTAEHHPVHAATE